MACSWILCTANLRLRPPRNPSGTLTHCHPVVRSLYTTGAPRPMRADVTEDAQSESGGHRAHLSCLGGFYKSVGGCWDQQISSDGVGRWRCLLWSVPLGRFLAFQVSTSCRAEGNDCLTEDSLRHLACKLSEQSSTAIKDWSDSRLSLETSSGLLPKASNLQLERNSPTTKPPSTRKQVANVIPSRGGRCPHPPPSLSWPNASSAHFGGRLGTAPRWVHLDWADPSRRPPPRRPSNPFGRSSAPRAAAWTPLPCAALSNDETCPSSCPNDATPPPAGWQRWHNASSSSPFRQLPPAPAGRNRRSRWRRSCDSRWCTYIFEAPLAFRRRGCLWRPSTGCRGTSEHRLCHKLPSTVNFLFKWLCINGYCYDCDGSRSGMRSRSRSRSRSRRSRHILVGAGAGAGAAETVCPEPEPEPEP